MRCLLRRADEAEVAGQALMLAVAGRGHRAAAEQLGLPAATVHGWLRRAAALGRPGIEAFLNRL